jgi:hypothetical protein
LAVDERHDVVGRDRPVLGDRPAHRLQPLGDERAVGVDVRRHVGERACVTGEAQARLECRDPVQRGEELAHRVGGPAVVEVQRHATEQVVAGDQQAPVRLVQADVRRGVAGGLDDRPRAEVGVDDDAVDELAVGFDEARDAASALAGARGPFTQRLQRHTALQGDLEAPRADLVGVVDGGAHVGVVGVHPQRAAAGVDDARRLPVVVGVRVRADEQPHVLEAQIALRQRALELGQRAGLVQAAVEQHHAIARRHRPGVAVRDAGPGQRQAQTPDARQDPFAAPELATPRRGRHRADDTASLSDGG